MPDGSAVSKKTKAGPISADRLKSFVERIEKLFRRSAEIGPALVFFETALPSGMSNTP